MNENEDYRHLKETFISRKEIYDGIILHVVHDTVRLPDGNTSTREVVLHNGAVCVVPITEDGCVIMEKQYRYGVDEVILEIPAGKLEKGEEDTLAAAARELEEETGYFAEKYEYLGAYYSSPAILSEKIYMYVATGLTEGEYHRDFDEFLDVVKIPLKETVDLILSGKIPDGKTQTAILRVYAGGYGKKT